MNEEAVQDLLTQAGIPCQITNYLNQESDGMVVLTGTPYSIQVGNKYLMIAEILDNVVTYRAAIHHNPETLLSWVQGLDAMKAINTYRFAGGLN